MRKTREEGGGREMNGEVGAYTHIKKKPMRYCERECNKNNNNDDDENKKYARHMT